MNLISKRKYIEPYPQEALDGEMGLSSKDIAISLGVPVDSIHKKIKRNKWCDVDEWKPKSYVLINENNRLDAYYSFTTDGAKAFVARYVNKIGDGYLKYLFDCERIVQNEIPTLIKKLEALQSWNIRKTKKKTFMVRTMAFIQKGLFGDEIEITQETKPYHDLSENEKRSWRFKHRSKIAEGLNKKNNEELSKGNVIAISSSKLLDK